MDYHAALSDPAEFRRIVIIDVAGTPRRLAEVVEPWQEQDFERIDPALRRAAGLAAESCPMRAWLERPRGHSKTSDLAIMAVWWLLVAPIRVAGIVAAADADQAGLLRDAISKLVLFNPWLAQAIAVGRQRVVNKLTGSELTIISSDVASSWGHNVSLIIADEVAHWQRRELFDSLLSTAAKRADCLFVCITNAGFQESWVWPVREAIRNDPAWIFSRLDGPVASWITADRLDEQQRLLPPLAYRRLWLNEWASGAGDALPADAIKRALTLRGPCLSLAELGDGWITTGGIDLGLRRDKSALVCVAKHIGHSEEIPVKPRPKNRMRAVLEDLYPDDYDADEPEPESVFHPGSRKVRLLSVQTWQGSPSSPVSISQIEAAVIAASQRWNLQAVCADFWSAAQLCERLRTAGVAAATIDPTGSNLREQASELLSLFNEKRAELYPDENLLRDLRSARVVERSFGFRIEADRTAEGHADALSAYLLAILASRRLDYAAPSRVVGELVCWP